jgi:hypothetical protein
MKKIIKVISVKGKLSKYNKKFFLSEVELSDNEVYSLASSKVPQVGDECEAWFDDHWNKPVAKYPKSIDNTVKQEDNG